MGAFTLGQYMDGSINDRVDITSSIGIFAMGLAGLYLATSCFLTDGYSQSGLYISIGYLGKERPLYINTWYTYGYIAFASTCLVYEIVNTH
ncbi:hypothetical protein HDV04_000484 [Boothiomyces sp. JEL0838]|nr:hypothetical protein HDV04_000484 [Boothiomyces sp. JEL0838]